MADKDMKPKSKDEGTEPGRKDRVTDLPAGAKDQAVKGGGSGAGADPSERPGGGG
jgi:hypothetical protein